MLQVEEVDELLERRLLPIFSLLWCFQAIAFLLFIHFTRLNLYGVDSFLQTITTICLQGSIIENDIQIREL